GTLKRTDRLARGKGRPVRRVVADGKRVDARTRAECGGHIDRGAPAREYVPQRAHPPGEVRDERRGIERIDGAVAVGVHVGPLEPGTVRAGEVEPRAIP